MPIRLPLVVFSMLITALSAYAQGACDETSPTRTVKGRVIAPGAPFDQYHEVLLLDEIRLVTWGYTNSTGEFTIQDAPVGDYYIVTRIDGFKEFREKAHIFSCSTVFDFAIFLDFEDPVFRPVILDFTGEVNEAVDVAELKRVFPKKAIDEFERARANRLSGEQDRARARLEKLINDYPEFYDARNALGSVYLEMKRYREAETQYNKARELRPNSAAPLMSLGSLYVQEAEASLNPEPGANGVVLPGGDLGLILSDARSVLAEAIKIKPDASFAHYLLGVAYMRGTNNSQAEASLRKAIEIEPKLRWARVALGNLYVKQGRLKDAVAEFDVYLMEFPKVSNRSEIQQARAKVAVQLAKESK